MKNLSKGESVKLFNKAADGVLALFDESKPLFYTEGLCVCE